MATRQLGNTGVQVSSIGLGCMALSAVYGKIDADQVQKVYAHAIETGCTFWDTSSMYGFGQNEKDIGKALEGKREKVFLATKFGYVFENGEMKGVRGDPEFVKQSFADSLKRLNVDHVDLLYQHRVDKNVPIEETVKAMKELQDAGKTTYLGLSECSAETLKRALKVARIDAVQLEYSPWSTHIERDGMLDLCREEKIALIAYSPLGRGFISGKFKSPDDFEQTDNRRRMPRFQGDNFTKNLKLVEQIKAFADKKGVTPSQLTLAWILAQDPLIIPIPGTKNIQRLDENMASTKITLSQDELKEIRQILDSFKVSGDRYAASQMAVLDSKH